MTPLPLQLVKKVVQSRDTACLQPTLDVFHHEDRQRLRGHCHTRALSILRARPGGAEGGAHTREAIAYLSLAIFAAGRRAPPVPGAPILCGVCGSKGSLCHGGSVVQGERLSLKPFLGAWGGRCACACSRHTPRQPAVPLALGARGSTSGAFWSWHLHTCSPSVTSPWTLPSQLPPSGAAAVPQQPSQMPPLRGGLPMSRSQCPQVSPGCPSVHLGAEGL